MEKERRILISFGAAALLGLLAGVAAPKLFRMGDGSYAGFFSLYSFGKFAQLPDSDFTQLFWYLLVKRLRLICFLWMSSYTPFGFFAHLLLLFWIFFAGGMLLSLFLLRRGQMASCCSCAACFRSGFCMYLLFGRAQAVILARMELSEKGTAA